MKLDYHSMQREPCVPFDAQPIFKDNYISTSKAVLYYSLVFLFFAASGYLLHKQSVMLDQINSSSLEERIE